MTVAGTVYGPTHAGRSFVVRRSISTWSPSRNASSSPGSGEGPAWLIMLSRRSTRASTIEEIVISRNLWTDCDPIHASLIIELGRTNDVFQLWK